MQFHETRGGHEFLYGSFPRAVRGIEELNENIKAMTDAINKNNALMEQLVAQRGGLQEQAQIELQTEKQSQMQTIKKVQNKTTQAQLPKGD